MFTKAFKYTFAGNFIDLPPMVLCFFPQSHIQQLVNIFPALFVQCGEGNDDCFRQDLQFVGNHLQLFVQLAAVDLI